MKNNVKYLLFLLSILNLMFLSGVLVYAAMTTEISLGFAAVLILLSGIAFGSLMYHGYDINK